MNYGITKTAFADLKPMMDEYLTTLNGVTDDFLEEHVKNAEHYAITMKENKIGYFAIFHKDKITQFYIIDKYLNLAQPIFQDI
jgi:hypothetical protein